MTSPHPHEKEPAIPRITAEDLEAFQDSRDFETDFNTFKKDQPELAHWLVTGHLGDDQEYLRVKRAYLTGIVGYHALLKTALEVARFSREIEEAESSRTNDDGDGDAGLQPSA